MYGVGNEFARDDSDCDIDSLEFPRAEETKSSKIDVGFACQVLCGYICRSIEKWWAKHCGCCVPCRGGPLVISISAAIADGTKNVRRRVSVYLKDDSCRNISASELLGFIKAENLRLEYFIGDKIEQENKKSIIIYKTSGTICLV